MMTRGERIPKPFQTQRRLRLFRRTKQGYHFCERKVRRLIRISVVVKRPGVIARHTAMQYKRSGKALNQIACEPILGARSVPVTLTLAVGDRGKPFFTYDNLFLKGGHFH